MQFIRLNEVMTITSMSRSTIYKYISENKFPRTVSLGDRAVAWIKSEVDEWMEQKLANRDNMLPKC